MRAVTALFLLGRACRVDVSYIRNRSEPVSSHLDRTVLTGVCASAGFGPRFRVDPTYADHGSSGKASGGRR